MATTAEKGPGRAKKKSSASGGRTTASAKSGAAGSIQSNRYTPPIAKSQKASPKWFGILIIAMFLLGVLIVILNYAGILPGGVNNLWLIGSIGAIFAGLLLATRYH